MSHPARPARAARRVPGASVPAPASPRAAAAGGRVGGRAMGGASGGIERARRGAGVCCVSQSQSQDGQRWSHCKYVAFGIRAAGAPSPRLEFVPVQAARGSPGCSLRAPGHPRCSVPLFPAAQDGRDAFLSLPAGTTYSFRRPSLNHLRPSCLLSRLPQTCDFASSRPLPGWATIMEMPVPRYARPRQIWQHTSSFALHTSRRPSLLPLDARVLSRNPSCVRIRVQAHLPEFSSSVFSLCAAPSCRPRRCQRAPPGSAPPSPSPSLSGIAICICISTCQCVALRLERRDPALRT
ncbi:hypothetical protein C8T65DRAFT_100235 [Cerioporus squamosus]|nr:hypothetical protein C8T65DRAFT_100235 [Cerioporus squamosus]